MGICEETMRIIIGDYKLKYALDCNIDLMGKVFDIQLGDITGKILFPKLAPDFIRALDTGKLESTNSVIPGPICPIDGFTSGNKQDFFGRTHWGQTMSYPNGDTIVEHIMLEFSSSENAVASEMQTVYNLIDNWFERLYDIYEIHSRKPIKSSTTKTPTLVKGYGFTNSNLLLYGADPLTKKLVPIHNDIDNNISISLDFSNGLLDYEQFSFLVNLANTQNELNFCYKFFLEGTRAFNEGDYKKAITVCAPALEATLLEGIKQFATRKNIYFLDKLLHKYRMLGGYFELAKDIQMDLPTNDYKDALVKLRNDVTHQGYSPAREETEKYLNDVRLYLDTFSTGWLSP